MSSKFQTQNPKIQTNAMSKISNSKSQAPHPKQTLLWEFGTWGLKFVWILLFGAWSLLTPSVSVHAASYDLKDMTPEIQQALSSRQSRYGQLQSLKSEGAVGETYQGYVAVLKPIPGAQEITAQENQDRRTLYQAIVNQNALGSQGLSEVERAFGEVQRDKARSGDMIQTSSGSWTQK